MTKLRIDLNLGVLEVEGEETFVTSIYDDFKKELMARVKAPEAAPKPTDAPKPATPDDSSRVNGSKSKSRAKGSKESYSIIKDLDLTATSNGTSLKDFYKQKAPATLAETNVVFVYYLKETASVNKVDLDHVFTCYRDVGARLPGAFKQSVADASSKKGWLDTESFDDIKLSLIGRNYVEHDLPKKGE